MVPIFWDIIVSEAPPPSLDESSTVCASPPQTKLLREENTKNGTTIKFSACMYTSQDVVRNIKWHSNVKNKKGEQ